MAGKKSSRASNISATASPKVPTLAAKKSSILRSSFAPSAFQLSLFASVIQGFESQQLRIHDISTGRVRCEYSAGGGAQINSLDWGYYSPARQQSQKQNKKRKRQANGVVDGWLPEDAVIALTTSEADVRLFSPSEDKVVAILKGPHDREVKQFQFTEGKYSEGWSIGADGRLVQWDITTQQPLQTITLPSDSISTLARPILKAPQILCASSTPYAISVDTSSDSEVTTYDAFRNPVHTLVRSAGASDDQTDVFIASDSDRYLNLYNVKEQRLAKTLVAEFEVGSFTTSSSGDILAAVTNNGVIQLFKAPFSTDLASQSTLSKKPKRPGPARPDATVRLVRPGSSITPVPLVASTVDKSDLIFAWVESGVNVTFDRVRWQAEGSNALAFEGVKDIVRSKSSSLLNSVTANGVHEVGKTYVDDSQAVVAGGATNGPNGESVDVDMDDDQEDEEEASEEESETEVVKNQSNAAASEAESSEVEADEEEEQAEAVQGSDAEMADIDGSVADQEEEPAEPSFGQLLARKHPSPIAVPNTIARADGLKNKELSIPSGLSLATVLTQSLRTNDQNLLESCFHTTDTATVRLTIQRLDSSLAATLLQKLADRLARRPGRYGHLLVWVQWTCVAHGGAIAGRPDVLQKIQSLFHVLQQRSKSLDNLLLLKGKLDMLDAQISLRKQMQAERQSRIGGGGTGNTITANEEDIIYIEGQDNDSSSSDEETILPPTSSSKSKRITRDKSSTKKPRKSLSKLIPTNTADDESERLGSSEDSDDEDMPLQTNGIPTASEEEEESSSEDEYDQTPYIQKASNKNGGEAIIDDEASEESHPSDLDNSEDDDAEEEDSEDSEMDDFINDEEEESIEEISDDDDDDDDLEEIPVVRKKLKGRA